MCRSMKQDPYLTTYTNINSKWIRDLDTLSGNIKLLEENSNDIPQDIGIDKDFLESTPEAQAIKNKNK